MVENNRKEIEAIRIDNENEKNKTIESLKSRLETAENKYNNLKEECERKRIELEEKYLKEKESLRDDLDSRKKQEIKDLTDKYNQNEKKLQSNFEVEKERLIKDYDQRIFEQKKELEEKHAQNEEKLQSDFKHEKETLINEYERKIQELILEKNQEIDNLKMQSEADKNKAIRDMVDKNKKESDKINGPYKALLEKIIRCDSLNSYSNSKGLREIYNSNSDQKILDFRSIVGSDYQFAMDICNALYKFKNNNRYPISLDEIELIEEINKFYREKNNISDSTDDILFLPRGFRNDNVSGAKVPFYSSEMEDIDDPLEIKFEYISEVYSPCFKKYESSNPQIKALVKGIKG